MHEWARHMHRSLIDFEDGFERSKARDPIPCAAAQRAIGPSPDPGPLLYVGHRRTPERERWAVSCQGAACCWATTFLPAPSETVMRRTTTLLRCQRTRST